MAMLSFRTLCSFSLALLLGAVNIWAQPSQPVQRQSPQTIQQPTPHVPVQQSALQQQPMQAQPLRTPYFGAPLNPAAQQPPANAAPAEQSYRNQQPVVPQNAAPGQVRVATTQQPLTLYGQGSTQPTQIAVPMSAVPMSAATLNRSPSTALIANPRPAAPVNQVVPYTLNPAEQQELDAFLVRWEKYSAGVKRYDVDFNLFIYNAAIPGADPNKPYKVAYGYFKYIANPRRFVYVVEGEWQGAKQIKRDGDKNPQIFAEKIIIDEKSVCKYDYNSKTVHQINVPPELIGKGIADSPLPLIFGARADELKRRFSMKVVNQGELLRLYARPLLIEDQQEFKELEILLHKQNLTARGLKQWSTSDKEFNVYDLTSPKINDRLSFVADDLKSWFAKTIDRDWKYEVTDWVAAPVPPPAPAMMQPMIASPPNVIPLYQAQ